MIAGHLGNDKGPMVGTDSASHNFYDVAHEYFVPLLVRTTLVVEH